VTRADIYGFCVPFAVELMNLYRESGIPIKIRLCDTLGYGVPYPNAVLPRSVPKILHAMRNEAGVPNRFLEWHGHNDFDKVTVNATTAWIYGCSAVNASVLGIGERTGNPPLESTIIDYISLKGYDDEIETRMITEIAEYFKKELKYDIPINQPFVGADFNVTRAGIHADGMLKNEEIYNVFDTASILNRPPSVAITDKSGTAGIAQWINDYLKLEPRSRIDKRHPGIQKINQWIVDQYKEGRVTSISNDEMLELAYRHLSEYFEFDLASLRSIAHELAASVIEQLAANPAMVSMKGKLQEPLLEGVFKKCPFVQLAVVADKNGKKNTPIYVRSGKITKEDEQKLDKNYTKRAWFIVPFENGTLHVTDIFKSKITGMLGITVSAPIKRNEHVLGVLRLDCKFENLVEEARRRFGGGDV
ncbi:MAG: histone-lysine N-methyltransferase, partial [bacterium]